jgi:hypothetical protein
MPVKNTKSNLEEPVNQQAVMPGAPVIDDAAIKKPSGIFKRKPMLMAFAAVVLVAIIAIGFFYLQTIRQKKLLAVVQKQLLEIKPSGSSSAENSKTNFRALIEEVGKLIILPDNEQPTVATVTDLEKLRGQPFFTNAQVGDTVLIYSLAKKAILYRPNENKIIELAPLNTADTQTTASSSAGILTVEIRNGSGKSGAALLWKEKLSSNKSFIIPTLGNATNSNYTRTLLVDKSDGSKNDLVNELQKLTGASVVREMPKGEASLTGEVLLIIGKN